jgi:hypothetical protein
MESFGPLSNGSIGLKSKVCHCEGEECFGPLSNGSIGLKSKVCHCEGEECFGRLSKGSIGLKSKGNRMCHDVEESAVFDFLLLGGEHDFGRENDC